MIHRIGKSLRGTLRRIVFFLCISHLVEKRYEVPAAGYSSYLDACVGKWRIPVAFREDGTGRLFFDW